MRKTGLIILILVLALAASLAQRWGGGRRGGGDTGIAYTEGGVPVEVDRVRTAREIASHSTGTPEWTNAPGLEKDVFTFVRIIRARDPSGPRSAGSWITDFPDSDLNLSYRLQQATTIKTDPDGRVLRLTDPDLFNYPWIYMVEPGALLLHDEEVPILRKYLLNGGVLMADDFWGQAQWEGFASQIKRVLQNKDFVDLDISHPLFHCVFDIKGPIQRLQTPSIHVVERRRSTDYTWEDFHRDQYGYPEDPESAHYMHVRAIFDDKGRIMVIATHNCDNGDSWEREGEDDFFFHEFSEKRGYPLGINIIYYLMTN